MASIEEKVEEYYKRKLDDLRIKHFAKTETINKSISGALAQAESKGGGDGKNYPDIKLLLKDKYSRVIPVMIEAKGTKNCLEKLDKNEEIIGITLYEKDQFKKDGTISHKKGDKNYSTIEKYAVNGALHYAKAILDYSGYEEVIAVGINAFETDHSGNVVNPECKAYYVSKKNKYIPKLIVEITADDWALFADSNINNLYKKLDTLSLTQAEIEKRAQILAKDLEKAVMDIHQKIYENSSFKTALLTNDKLYLFSGLIMASMPIEGTADLTISDFKSNNNENDNDGLLILNRIKNFLTSKNSEAKKIELITNMLSPVFKKQVLWKPNNGESILKDLFKDVQETVIPHLSSDWHLDFTGIILNKLSDWVQIDNDKENDVVLTPRYITNFMAKLARTNMNSFVWDTAMGSGGFLCSAMQIMIQDVEKNIVDKEEREKRIDKIKHEQLLGIEILNNIYVLAVLNMIIMGDGSSQIINDNAHTYNLDTTKFPPNVYLLNPPYSAQGKGFNFVEEALEKMTSGYACILIQDSAGNGQGLPYTKRILEHNTLEASIKMPSGLFGSKASVNVYIFVFEVNRPHEKDDNVIFIDFSEDGYTRQNRKKSTQEVNLRNTDHADERYEEVLAIVLNKKPKTEYYTESNGKVIKDTITLNGDDWLFTQHQVINTMPTEEDFKKTVANYLSWKVSQFMKGTV